MTVPLSPRRRRLRLTLAALCALAVLGAAAGAWWWARSRPTPYRPDEASADITSELARALPPEAPRPRFTDVTRLAGLENFRNFTGHRTSEMPEDIGPGLAWGDYDDDGDEDLFLVAAGGAMNLPENQLQPCRLYENLGDGRFQPANGFPDLRIHGNGAAWGDCDGDGFLDLVVSGYDFLGLFRNQPGEAGGARILVRDLRFPNPRGFWTGVAWGDYDNDRALDLYVCGYIDYVVAPEDRARSSQQIGVMVPFTLNPASFQAGTNLLFHNQRDGTFAEVGAALDVQNTAGRSLGAVWHDFDQDGRLDLYVANDISDNVFFRNTGNGFKDISHPALVADYRSAMGLAVGDFDRDGDDDLFVSHWVAQENGLYSSTWADMREPGTPEPATGRSTAPGATQDRYPLRFLDVADRVGLGQIALPYVGWGAEFVDLDQDGWLDLVVANGNTLEEEGPPPRKLTPQETFLFWNRRGEFFHNLAPLHPGLSARHNSRGLALADFDNDGDADLAIADLGSGVRLFRNDMATGHWIKIRLRTRGPDGRTTGAGHGCTAVARVGETALRRSVSSVSYLSQSSLTLHFGLGQATRIDRLEVRWLGGATNAFEGLEAGATYEIVEGEPTPRRRAPRIASASQPQTKSSTASTVPTTARKAASREQQLQFWNLQRAAMQALKNETNHAKAAALFRQALALDPHHEDSLYYHAACLVELKDVTAALSQLETLQHQNPQSQRAFAQWGNLRAITATNQSQLDAAAASLERAHQINPEETGALLVLGEIALLRGDRTLADRHLAAVCRTNPKAAGAFFLRGYLAWQRGDAAATTALLAETRAALGKDWQPRGSTSEGDVRKKQHNELTPLAEFWTTWNGSQDPTQAFASLDHYLLRHPAR